MSEWAQQVNSLSRHVDHIASIPQEEPFYSKRLQRQRESAAKGDSKIMKILKKHSEPISEKAIRVATGMSYARVYDGLRRLELEGKTSRMKTPNTNYWSAKQ